MQTTEAGRDSSVSLLSKGEDMKAHKHGWQVQTVQTAVVLSPQSCLEKSRQTGQEEHVKVTGYRKQKLQNTY